jgi:HNH endonuclease
MNSSSIIQQRWINIIQNHCKIYYPSFQVIRENYNINIEVIKDKNLTTEKRIENFYLCPLCLVNFVFIEEGLIYGNEEFDKDHFPPKSAGGSKTILVCKKCNSNYGKEFDYSIREYLNFLAFLKKKNTNIKSKISLQNVAGKYSTSWSWEDDKLVNTFDFKKYPLLMEGFLKSVGKTEEFKLNFNFSIPEELIIHKAFLKAAYLKCFAQWGYEFAYSYIGKNIISVLNDSKIHPLTNLGVFKEESEKPLQAGLYLVESPKEFQCFMYTSVGLLKGVDEFSNTFVLIPKFGQNAWEEFKIFQKLIPNGELTFGIKKIDGYSVHQQEYLGYSRCSQLC